MAATVIIIQRQTLFFRSLLASVIRDIPITPSLQKKIDAVNILRAVRGTTAIEGANASTEEVHEIMVSQEKQILPPSRSAGN